MTTETVNQPDPKEVERQAILARKPMYVNAQKFLEDNLPEDDKATVETDPSNKEKEATPETTPNPEEKRYKDRYDQLKGHHDRSISDYKKRIEALEAQVRNASNKTLNLPKTKEELEEFKKDYPDIYATMQSVALLEQQNIRKEIAAELEVVHKERANTRKEKALAALERAHPDWMELRDDPKFHEWVQLQPDVIQGWLYDNDDNASLAIRAVDLYKLENGLNKPKKQDKPKSDPKDAVMGVDLRGGGSNPQLQNNSNKKIWTESEIAKLKPAEFDKVEAEIMIAMREGRVKSG